ncbi:MAG TPA: hypothetical protein VGG30_12825 [Pirellulales bacterium]|jgi:hypothetical protein
MHRGPVLRNSLIVALPEIAILIVAALLAVGLPLFHWVRGAEAAEGSTGQVAATERPGSGASKNDRGETNAAGVSAGTSGPAGQREPADSREIADLIRQLGNRSYTVRQRATKRLIELGIITQPLLTQALEDDDAEVRSRAAQVLDQVVEADFHLRLEAFANDLEGRQQHTLPGWGRFSQIFGQDKVSRMLFVEMQRSEPALLEALDPNPKLAGELFVMRIQLIRQSLQFPPRDGTGPATISLGTICSLLLVSAADGVTVSDQDALQLGALFKQTAFQRILQDHVGSNILKKMLGDWIVHNSSPALAHQNLDLAFTLDLKEGLNLAVKLLANEGRGQLPAIRQDALLAIGRFGNHTHIALVEPLLKDADFCSPQQGNDPGQSQVRDVALAVLIHLSGQELKAYGLDHVPPHLPTVFQPGMIAFADPLMRKEALRKWEIWAGRDGAAGRDKAAAAKDAPNQPGDAKPNENPAPGPAPSNPANRAATNLPAAQPTDRPATKSDRPTPPRPAELIP